MEEEKLLVQKMTKLSITLQLSNSISIELTALIVSVGSELLKQLSLDIKTLSISSNPLIVNLNNYLK